MSLQGDIEQAARRMERFTTGEMRVAVSGRSRKSTHNAILSLAKAGILRRRAKGVYEIVPGAKPLAGPAPGEGQKRLWKLMKMQPRFGISELAMLAELSLDYTKKYLYHLKRLGHLVEVGRTKHPDGIHRVPHYALAAKSRDLQAPPYRRFLKGGEKRARTRAECLDAALEVVEAIRKGESWEAVREKIGKLDTTLEKERVGK